MTTHKNRLPQSALIGYISPAPHKTGAGFRSLLTVQAHNRASGFFTCKASSRLFRIMAGRTGEPQGSPGSWTAGTANLVRLATPSFAALDGELPLSVQGSSSWQTVNNASATPAPTFSASTHKQKSPASSTVLIRWHTSFAPNYLTCPATACRYGCLPSWTTSPTISATFSDCLTSQRTPRNAPPMRPCSSGAFVHPVNREVWL
ncbi:TPA: ash family protein [Salmonella enterica subsp. enterica serovar Orientalis]|nr:ash family protein [Salmonella enterica subsp. enterica serovar Orientalis]